MTAESNARNLADDLDRVLARLEQPPADRVTGIPAGFAQFDALTGGLHRGDLVVLASRPTMGKTALLLTIAARAAVAEKLPVAVFALNMPRCGVVDRVLAGRADLDLRAAGRARGREECCRLRAAADALREAVIMIDDTPYAGTADLATAARGVRAGRGVEAVFIDDVQFLGDRGSGVAARLKALAGKLGLPVVCTAPLARCCDDRPFAPQFRDLRGPGDLAVYADVVALLHCEDYYHRGDPAYTDTGTTALIVAKNRRGPCGGVDLVFRAGPGWFEEGGLTVSRKDQHNRG